MKLPEKQYMNICKVFQEVCKNNFLWGKRNEVEVGRKGSKMTCSFTVKPIGCSADEIGRFSYYDAAVCDAVYSIYMMGSPKFTLTNLLRVMASDERIRVSSSETRAQELRTSLVKLSSVEIEIDCREEARSRGLKASADEEDPWLIRDRLLPVYMDGRGVYWFLMDRELPLYRYAGAIGQMICIDGVMLDLTRYVKEAAPEEERDSLLSSLAFKNSKEVILLKRILLRRLAIAKNPNNSASPKILYYGPRRKDGILPLIGINREDYAQDRHAARASACVRFPSSSWGNKVREVDRRVCAILDAYSLGGYIDGYKQLRDDKRSLTRGVEIFFSKQAEGSQGETSVVQDAPSYGFSYADVDIF